MITHRQAVVRLSRVVSQSLTDTSAKLRATSQPGANVEQLLHGAIASTRQARVGAELVSSLVRPLDTSQSARSVFRAVDDTTKAIDELQQQLHEALTSRRVSADLTTYLGGAETANSKLRTAARNLPEAGGEEDAAYWTALSAKGKSHLASLESTPAFPEPAGEAMQAVVDSTIRSAQSDAASFATVRSYSSDMVESAAAQGPGTKVFGRLQEIRRTIEATAQRDKPSVVLSGPSGTGKTKILEGVAGLVAAGDVPTHLRGAKLFQLDPQALVRGASARGDLETRVGAIVNEIVEARTVFGDNVYLVLDNLDNYVRDDVLALLKPSIADGSVPVIASGDVSAVARLVDGEAQLARQFTTVPVEPLGVDDALNILRGAKGGYETHYGARVTDDALAVAARLANDHSGKPLPDSAVDLIDASFARTSSTLHGTPGEIVNARKRIGELDVIIPGLEDGAALGDKQAAARATAFGKEREDLSQQLDALLSQQTAERVAIDQRIEAVEAIRAARGRGGAVPPELTSRLEEANQAVASVRERFKTPLLSDVVDEEVVRSVATQKYGVSLDRAKSTEAQELLELEDFLRRRVYGQDSAISEVSEAVRIARMGLKPPSAPQGNFLFMGPTGVGKTELARALAERIHGSERAMVRFDMGEFGEKHTAARLVGAPPGYAGYESGGELTNAISRKPASVVLFDEMEKAHRDVPQTMLGYLEEGHLTDGRGTAVDASNVLNIFTTNIMTEEGLARHFAPEFLNRIDAVIRFDELAKSSVEGILDKNMTALTSQAAARGVDVELTPQARAFLVDAGYDPALGGRPMNRAVKRHVAKPVATEMLNISTTRELDPTNPVKLRLTYEAGDSTLHIEGGARPTADSGKLVDVGSVVRGGARDVTAGAQQIDVTPPTQTGGIKF